MRTSSLAALVAVLVPAAVVPLAPQWPAPGHAAHAASRVVVLRGRVTNAAMRGDSAAVEGAQVRVAGTGAGAITGPDGRYVLTLPEAASGKTSVTLQVRRIGYESVERRVRLDRDTITVDVALTMAATMLQSEVVDVGAAAAGRNAAKVLASPRPYAPTKFAATTAARDVAEARRHVARDSGDTENYAVIEDNAFLDVARHPLSTFSADVDRASYGNVRRFIMAQGTRPPRDAVRIEELINYFPYDYAAPRGDDPFSVTSEVTAAPWAPTHRLVRVALQAKKIPTAELPPVNLVFLIDVSGSMMEPNKLPLVKEGFRMLVDQLREQDRVAIVVYAGNAGLVLPSTSGADKERIVRALDGLEAGGSTAGGAGINLAYDVARQNFRKDGTNRVILATDGDFNVGASSDAELVRLVERRRAEGTFLTVLGFGTGNLKDSRMEQLADKGNGHYAYVDDALEARKVFVTELGGTLVTVAKDVKLQVEFNPAKVGAYRLIGYENRALADEDFNDDRKDAGEIGAGHSVTALYEVVPKGLEREVARPVDAPRYDRPAATSATAPNAGGDELLFVKVRYKRPDGDKSLLLSHAVPDRAAAAPSTDLAFAAAVAEFGMSLRESPWRGTSTLDASAALARRSLGTDPGGYRAAFVKMVETARGKEMARKE